ncbi:hypothetical protein KI688_006893 [Linnemannia hyalina]|uniref:Uncharacterized protein n=1 Tax=Linnemannia hyalina TaxID=64524 RepID=A0A9P7XJN9_9FUNG|nr:hypothetical protein KI688_006893 [Linnemannia hyalina]
MVETNHDTDTVFQAFRSETDRREVLIPAVRHPTLGELYVIWTDITDCFPRASRIQHDDEFIPFLRDDNLVRVKPFGVPCHPGVVLDVILGETPFIVSKRRANGRPRNSSNRNHHASNITTNSMAHSAERSGLTNGDSGVIKQQGKSSDRLTVKSKDESGGKVEMHPTVKTQEGSQAGSGGLSNTSIPQQAASKNQAPNSKEQPPRASPTGSSATQTSATPVATNNTTAVTTTAVTTTEDGALAGQKAVWNAIAGAYNSTLPYKRPPHSEPTDLKALVELRVKTILKDYLSWTQSCHPRFFCFLPIVPDPGPNAEADGEPNLNEVIQSDTKFQLYYFCDCGDVPGFEGRWYGHWTIKEGEHYLNNATGESTTQAQLDDIIPLVGTSMMAYMEALKYGAYVNDELIVPPQTHPDAQRRISLAIRYFESKGVRSSEGYWRDRLAGVRSEDIKPVTSPLHKHRVEFWRIVEKNRWVRLSELIPFKTTGGDVRWVCQSHWHALTNLADVQRATDFSKNPQSTKSEYRMTQGAFITEILSMQRAREFFQLAERMTSTVVLRVSLDWDLTSGDEDELNLLIGRLSATALHLTVRRKTRCASGALVGFASGYVQLTLAAIWNPSIEIFMLLFRPPADEPDYSTYYERHYMLSSCDSLCSDTIATLMKLKKGAPARAILQASDIDLAAASFRKLAKGFHYFSELQLTKESIQVNAMIKFKNKFGDSEPIPKDTDYNNGDLFKYFEQREWIDDVECDCSEATFSQLLLLHNLTKVVTWFSLKQDRVKFRELIRFNKKLKELTLHDTERDDPSQIFETYKALLANHPVIELFEVRQHHIDSADSTFAWKNPKESTKMRVAITCYAGDKVQSMLQKYAPLIDRLTIEHLKASDASVLEKSTRPKKGPLSLRWLGIHNVHLLEAAVLDDLKKVILRSDIDQVMVTGSTFKASILLDDATTLARHDGSNTSRRTVAKGGAVKKRDDFAEEKANVGVWAEFIMGIRTKLTDMSISTKDPANILAALEAQVVPGEQPDMIRLQGFTMTGVWTQSILSYPWMERLLLSTGHGATATYLEDGRRKQILTKVTLTGSQILEEDWKRILKSWDLFQMVRLHIRQKSRLSVETLLAMIEAIPMNSPSLRQFLVDDSQPISPEVSRAFEAKMRTKSEKFHTTVILQSLHMA